MFGGIVSWVGVRELVLRANSKRRVVELRWLRRIVVVWSSCGRHGTASPERYVGDIVFGSVTGGVLQFLLNAPREPMGATRLTLMTCSGEQFTVLSAFSATADTAVRGNSFSKHTILHCLQGRF